MQISLACKSYPITRLDSLLALQEVEAPRISRQSAHESGRPYLPAACTFLVLISDRG